MEFIEKVYKIEYEAETQVLGDIDFKNEDEQNEPVFYFSLEEIKIKFQDFLNLTAESETHLEDGEAYEEVIINENKDYDEDNLLGRDKSDEEESWENADVVQEIKDLDQSNPETINSDFNYWKPVIDYNLDDLINDNLFVSFTILQMSFAFSGQI